MKKAMKKAGGTLFSYFQPSSSAPGPKQPPTTPKASKTKVSKTTTPASEKRPRKGSVLIGGDEAVSPGLLVWAKMEGHPWWPGMVTPHPPGALGRVLRGKKCPEVHVQFFGRPPTRGWVPVKHLEVLTQGSVGQHQEEEVGFEEAMQEAGEAIGLTLKARLEDLVVDIPSEDEQEEGKGGNQENVEPMDATPSRRKRLRPLSEDDDDSDSEIGVRKTKTGRPKRTAAMSIKERVRAKKRPRRSLDSDDSVEEYHPGSEEGESEECSSGEGEGGGESEATPTTEEEEESVVTPAKKKGGSGRSVPLTPKTPSTPLSTFSSPASTVKATPTSSPVPQPARHSGPFLHERLEWLKEENRRDKSGRGASDPDYNPRTVRVPPDFTKKLTPALKQWWHIKADNFDTVLMFKVGKFYELYHMDAVTGVQELGLVFMKGEFAHSGFPEIAFGRYAQTLVQKGYKVARIEQTETPQMMEQRVKTIARPTKFDRVVKRELCSVTSKGTRTLSFFDGDLVDTESSYLMAVREKPHPQSQGESIYGVCFLDTCIGRFHLGQFTDDRQCSRLRTLIAHHPPAQVLYERGNLSARTLHVVNQLLATSIRDCLAPNSEFWGSSQTLKHLAEDGYFLQDQSDEFQWPEVLKGMLAEEDSLGLTATDCSELAISALGACVWCLKRCCIDHELLSMGNFEKYTPLDATAVGGAEPDATTTAFARQHMILDDITLANLDVLDTHGKIEGTLLDRIDHCVTAFGKRTIKQWLCAPLCNPQAINERLDAVSDLMTHLPLMGEAKDVLRTLPDLERLLRKIHTMGSTVRSQDHPDGRAIFYEETTYSKRKISDFISVLDGLQSSLAIPKVFGAVTDGLTSRLLKGLVMQSSEGGRFPDIAELLHTFQCSFDHGKAKKEGVIVPSEGMNASYDDALRGIQVTKCELDDYLQRQRKRLGCRQIVYWGSGRNRYQLEIPEVALARHTPDEYELKSQKKGFRRYWTREIETMLGRLTGAEERRNSALRDTMRVLFQSFSEHLRLWDSAVQTLATLDVLMSLATYSCCGGDMCRPELAPSVSPFLELRESKHPCVTQTYTGDDFIPNDVTVNTGGGGATCLVVTGPNMGGKSTLMRQTGLIVVLAQMGCYVPASSCRLSPVDRVFTRLGASDRIMAGESTFFVELSETSTILQHATPHSLVLLDELGRGTATYDGTAIASAVVRELAETIRCRTLFSTHYHSLVEEFSGNTHIQLGHMACMVEEEEGEGDCAQETITFLYKFVEGACPKSYGFNAARLAGLPRDVIAVARRKAQDFERSSDGLKIFRQLMGLQGTFPLEPLCLAQRQISAMS